jgi:hypothetical protein
MTGKKVDIYRLSFDFSTGQEMLEFWDQFTAMNQQPDNSDGWQDTTLVHKDTLHDANKRVNHFLIRNSINGAGNGRPIELIKTPEKVHIA